MPAATTLRNLAPWLPTGVAVAFLLGSLVTVAGYAVRGDDPVPPPGRAAPLPPFSPETPDPTAPDPTAPASGASASGTPAPGAAGAADDRPEAAIGVADPKRDAPDRRVPEAQRSTPERARATGSAPARQRPSSGPGGTYRVVDAFPGGFIGEVLVENPARTDTAWTVTLTVPASMTGLVTSWVEGAPQATLEVDGRTYTWRSGVPVSAGGSVPLRFHFNREDGADVPDRCAVNGNPCTGL
ncbi:MULTISPECIES: cellulose binding domain-containing protein [Catenuloplanes]|uniref:CBM2 domain-containing protein n=1 Tax=Catenuloplanes niger TaxID=587534 RepID=A0AAE3ZVU8_9ACTN|nr:cellulose binding domain-containing protein [Catenuloplanes niger]MDR7326827.1 hypothetical protein [Catenuloplanes niger]